MPRKDLPYLPLVLEAARKADVPPALLAACADTESTWNPEARRYEAHLGTESRGLMQVLVTTAADLDVAPEALWDPASNLLAGARYLRQQYDKFPEIPLEGERWKFAVAAYNGGRGNINKALAHARLVLFGGRRLRGAPAGPWQTWDYVVDFLPPRTRAYTPGHIRKVWRALQRYTIDPALQGLL
ncbi:MAG TPA: transglycosylase SLT domain-containing protein [Thermoanaerobaculia bacterium]|nr:transglycosylase SLT domain-containing protein [Thermoanaerobaculia bacterium]